MNESETMDVIKSSFHFPFTVFTVYKRSDVQFKVCSGLFVDIVPCAETFARPAERVQDQSYSS